MAEEFAKSVDDGIRLSKRLYFGKDRAVAPPKPPPPMERSPHLYLPMAPMVYAVIPDPSIVDNPDIPSYQPHVHGRCDPPALIPLQMNGIELQADCFLDTALIQVSGTWRLHCVMGSKRCDCRIAIPMGEQGSILGVEVNVIRKSYSTQLIPLEEKKDLDKTVRVENGGFLKQNIFTLKVPQVDGGANLSIKIVWSQKLSFSDEQYTLYVPFTFPEFVIPAGKKLSKKEKIEVSINAGIEVEVLCKATSHPLKLFRRKAGKLGFLYEAEVLKWSSSDLNFSYAVSSTDACGSLLLQSPSVYDADQREMFCLYLLPGSQQSKKVFRKDVVFVIDISGSMRGKSLDATKNALSAALHKLNPEDSFSVIAFNAEVYQFSTSMEVATANTVEMAIQWIDMNFIPGDGTNILHPLNKAIEMLTDRRGTTPIVFLVTDGTVEDERHICDTMKNKLMNNGTMNPRIYTFGIGTFCNHYFLQMLANIGRGRYDGAYDVDSIEARMNSLFSKATSTVLANIAIDQLDDHALQVEMYPSRIPDVSSECPLTVFGRYNGEFPECINVKCIDSDLSSHVIELNLLKAKEIPLDKVFGKQQIDQLTAMAWLSEDKQLEDKIVKLSIQTGVPSEFTRMILQDTEESKSCTDSDGSGKGLKKKRDKKAKEEKENRMTMVRNLCVGFGDLTATMEEMRPGSEQIKLPEAAEMFVKAASNCCSRLCGQCCCMCCVQCCSKLNDQCMIAVAQLCTALACFGCLECCSDLCSCCGQE